MSYTNLLVNIVSGISKIDSIYDVDSDVPVWLANNLNDVRSLLDYAVDEFVMVVPSDLVKQIDKEYGIH